MSSESIEIKNKSKSKVCNECGQTIKNKPKKVQTEEQKTAERTRKNDRKVKSEQEITDLKKTNKHLLQLLETFENNNNNNNNDFDETESDENKSE